jgi:hypothetical protein
VADCPAETSAINDRETPKTQTAAVAVAPKHWDTQALAGEIPEEGAAYDRLAEAFLPNTNFGQVLSELSAISDEFHILQVRSDDYLDRLVAKGIETFLHVRSDAVAYEQFKALPFWEGKTPSRRKLMLEAMKFALRAKTQAGRKRASKCANAASWFALQQVEPAALGEAIRALPGGLEAAARNYASWRQAQVPSQSVGRPSGQNIGSLPTDVGPLPVVAERRVADQFTNNAEVTLSTSPDLARIVHGWRRCQTPIEFRGRIRANVDQLILLDVLGVREIDR